MSSGAIAREEEIPRRYLQALLRDLSAAGLLRVVRGRAGGYTLAKSAEEITIATISEAVGDPMAPTFCLGCKRMEQGCPAHEAWGQLAQEFRRALSRITVAQLTGSPAARKAPSQPGHTGAPPGAAT